MEHAVAASIADARSVATVLGLFATAAIGLAALGLYGVLAYFVSRKTHEIGVRVVLGATGGRVVRLVIARGMTLVAVGLVLGLVGARASSRLAEGMLFRTSANDTVTFLAVTGLFLLVALGACLLPAWRALRVDPADALRVE